MHVYLFVIIYGLLGKPQDVSVQILLGSAYKHSEWITSQESEGIAYAY